MNIIEALKESTNLMAEGLKSVAETQAAEAFINHIPVPNTGKVMAITLYMATLKETDSNYSLKKRACELALRGIGGGILSGMDALFNPDKIKGLIADDAIVKNMSNLELAAEIHAQRETLWSRYWNNMFRRVEEFNTVGKNKGNNKNKGKAQQTDDTSIVKLGTKEVPKVDDKGNPILDDKGNPVMEVINLIAESKREDIVKFNTVGKNPKAWPNTLYAQSIEKPDLTKVKAKAYLNSEGDAKKLEVNLMDLHIKITAKLVEWEEEHQRPYAPFSPDGTGEDIEYDGLDVCSCGRVCTVTTPVPAANATVEVSASAIQMGPALPAGALDKAVVAKAPAQNVFPKMAPQATLTNDKGVVIDTNARQCPRCGVVVKRKSIERYAALDRLNGERSNDKLATNIIWAGSELCGNCRQQLKEEIQGENSRISKLTKLEAQWEEMAGRLEKMQTEFDSLHKQCGELELTRKTLGDSTPEILKTLYDSIRTNLVGTKPNLEALQGQVKDIESQIAAVEGSTTSKISEKAEEAKAPADKAPEAKKEELKATPTTAKVIKLPEQAPIAKPTEVHNTLGSRPDGMSKAKWKKMQAAQSRR